MSAEAETDPRGLSAIADGDPAAGASAGSPGAFGRGARPPDAAGWLLGRLSALSALLAMAWLLAGLPLLLAGRFTPVLMLVVSVPLAAVLIYFGLRWIPGRWQAIPLLGGLLAGALAFVILISLAVRSYLEPVRHHSAVQAAVHVRLNPPGVYWALALHWVFWYIGVPAVLLGTLGAALLARRCLRGRAPAWTLPLGTRPHTITVCMTEPVQ